MATAAVLDIDRLKTVCAQIVDEGDLDALTGRTVRRDIEKRLELRDKVLEEQPYKQIIKDKLEELLTAIYDKDKEEEEIDEEEEYSDVNDDVVAPPPAKRQKKDTAAPTTEIKSSAKTKSNSSSNTTVTNLKNYIAKCGVRKVWTKELAGMSISQQAQQLKKILADLGMKGRPTLKKCKNIKAQRDLQAELEAIQPNSDNSEVEDSQPTSRSRRRAAAPTTKSFAEEELSDSQDEDEDEEVSEEESESDAYSEDESGEE